MLKIIFVFLFITFFGFSFSQEKANPFITQIGKTYEEYHDVIFLHYDSVFGKSTIESREVLNWLSEAAEMDTTGEWSFNYRILSLNKELLDSRNGYVLHDGVSIEQFAQRMLSLSDEAEKKGLPLISLRALFDAAEMLRIYAQDYEQSFSLYLKVTDGLDKLTTKEFPIRPYMYLSIGGIYYSFREYEEAKPFYQKIVEDTAVYTNIYKAYYPALNSLGLCYRNGEGNYEKSDSCFYEILRLASSNDTDRWLWDGIAEGNIGYNHYLRGDLEAALEWMIPAISKISRPNDYAYVSSRAVNIARIYLEKKQPKPAKKYIDIALDYHKKSGIPQKSSRLYDVITRYYMQVGNKQVSEVYMDSTIATIRHENEAFSGLVLHRVEQQLRATDRQLHEQELKKEKIKSQGLFLITIIVSSALIIISILLALIIILYRRKRNAYRKLVVRSKEWAKVDNTINIGNNGYINTSLSNGVDKKTDTQKKNGHEYELMEKLNSYILNKKIYLEESVTLDMLAKNLGVNRVVLSQTINHVTGKNFSSYLNDYRVKEAIRILSTKKSEKLSIDQIAYDCGFNNRKSFYRVFKTITGISPSDFRLNNNVKDEHE